MTDHRYIFEKGSKKHHCPNCNKRRFVRYIDTETENYLPKHYGKCDRLINCGYELSPYKDGFAKAIWHQEQGNKTNWKPTPPKTKKKPLNKLKRAYIPIGILNLTRAGYEQNTFIQNLLSQVAFPFEVKDVEKVISSYHLGTIQNGYRKGANTFPFIDIENNVRAVQVKQFNEQNHTIGTDFLHSIIEKHHTRSNKPLPDWLTAYNKNETKVSCLFGEHLLCKHPRNPVALVEAPKTAIYGTLYFGLPEQPTDLIWLAVYNLSSLNLNKCKALEGRTVYLFPDLSKDGKAFDLWSNKATEIQKQLKGASFQVSGLLEQLAPEQDKEQGKDLADYLINQDWRLFRDAKKQVPEALVKKTVYTQEEVAEKPLDTLPNKSGPKTYVEDWSTTISELETFFSNATLPNIPVRISNCETVKNLALFVDTHLTIVKANKGKLKFVPYMVRLQKLKEHIIDN
jgi:hypothetical protein